MLCIYSVTTQVHVCQCCAYILWWLKDARVNVVHHSVTTQGPECQCCEPECSGERLTSDQDDFMFANPARHLRAGTPPMFETIYSPVRLMGAMCHSTSGDLYLHMKSSVTLNTICTSYFVRRSASSNVMLGALVVFSLRNATINLQVHTNVLSFFQTMSNKLCLVHMKSRNVCYIRFIIKVVN